MSQLSERTVKPSAVKAGLKFPELRTIRLGNGRLSYRDSGSGTPIVFFHGMNGDSRSWAYQFAFLAEKYRVIAWDAPGFGKSDVCPATIEGYAAVGMEFMEKIGASGAFLVGHSMGGVVATRIAATPGNTVKKLVLSCTHSGYGQVSGSNLLPRYASRIEEMKKMPKEEYGRIRASRMVPPDTHPDVLGLLAEISMEARPEGLEAAGRMVQETDNSGIFDSIAIPVLVLYAERDPVVKIESTLKLIKALPSARVVMMPSVGHAPYAEDPEAYNRIIDEFAKQL
jgi:pimeloyl-ACP methyl ester carboxylesterase